LTHWTETDGSNSVTFSSVGGVLRVTGSRVGAQSYPTVGYIQHTTERLITDGADWVAEINLANTISISGQGAIGFAIQHVSLAQYVAMEYDGTTITVRGVDGAGSITPDGTTYSVSNATWLRIQYTSSSDTIAFMHGTDGATWTTDASFVGWAPSNGTIPIFAPRLYWKSTDTNASVAVVNIAAFNWVDSQTIGRFGNWITISNGTSKWLLFHNQETTISLGDIVTAGQIVAYAGKSGFDSTSGRISTVHCHTEYHPNINYLYSADEATNPLDRLLIPRTNVSNNVTVNRTTANDPDGVSSWRLQIIVTRQSQDFDVNQITLTGNTTSRTINFNTRSGLNATRDIPKQSGVYIVPTSFNSATSTWEISVYFNKSTVGNTFVSYSITDTQGTVLASE
jgi:hypothetical protein